MFLDDKGSISRASQTEHSISADGVRFHEVLPEHADDIKAQPEEIEKMVALANDT